MIGNPPVVYFNPEDLAEERNTAEAIQSFGGLFLGLYGDGTLPAIQMCTGCVFAQVVVAVGNVTIYAIAPGRSSSNYQQHMNKVRGSDIIILCREDSVAHPEERL